MTSNTHSPTQQEMQQSATLAVGKWSSWFCDYVKVTKDNTQDVLNLLKNNFKICRKTFQHGFRKIEDFMNRAENIFPIQNMTIWGVQCIVSMTSPIV